MICRSLRHAVARPARTLTRRFAFIATIGLVAATAWGQISVPGSANGEALSQPAVLVENESGHDTSALAEQDQGAIFEGDRANQRLALEAAEAGNRVRASELVDRIRSDDMRNRAYQRVAAVVTERAPTDSAEARGGGTQADFGPLIQLIQTTIDPDGWNENGGIGAIVPFPTGVIIDGQGLLRHHLATAESTDTGTLTALGRAANAPEAPTTVRQVSLPRLERTLIRHLLAGESVPPLLLQLGGLTRITHVIADPAHHDLILAGPYDEKRPTLRLDDLLVLLASASGGDGAFGCAINPRAANLARTQEFLKTAGPLPLVAARRSAWLERFQAAVGRQDIVVHGVPASSHLARVIVAADYHMKLIGMGIESGEPFVTSYLDALGEDDPPGGAARDMDVLRWWFVLDYPEIAIDAEHRICELKGNGAKVLSESELLGPQGTRIHTGTSDPRNQAFAQEFSQALPKLAEKFDVYRQFRGVCDLAMAVAILREFDFPAAVGWEPRIDDPGFAAALVPVEPVPREVDSVVGERVLSPRKVAAGVSGGVECRPKAALAEHRSDMNMSLAKQAFERRRAPRPYEEDPRWWWNLPVAGGSAAGRPAR